MSACTPSLFIASAASGDRSAARSARSATSIVSPTCFGSRGFVKVRMLVIPSGPKNRSRPGAAVGRRNGDREADFPSRGARRGGTCIGDRRGARARYADVHRVRRARHRGRRRVRPPIVDGEAPGVDEAGEGCRLLRAIEVGAAETITAARTRSPTCSNTTASRGPDPATVSPAGRGYAAGNCAAIERPSSQTCSRLIASSSACELLQDLGRDDHPEAITPLHEPLHRFGAG